ncbi:MAG: MaoC family dehydratase [Dehalococcoidia bacterium]
MDAAPATLSVSRLVDQPRVDRYALAARDPNPIHRETPEAYAGPFGRPAAHGMLVLGLVSEAMTQGFGMAWANTGTVKVRWRAPGLTPFTATARADLKKDEGGVATYEVTCTDDAGETLLTGTATVRYAAA